MAIEPNKQMEASVDLVKKRNPAILTILDPLHRSLLNNNLQYEQVRTKCDSRDEQASLETDSDEYFTAISAIGSTDGATECDAISKSNKLLDANQNDSHVKGHRQFNQMHEQRQTSDFMHAFDSGNHITEKTRQLKPFDRIKQTPQQLEHLNVLDTKNRCDTIYQANGSITTQQRHLTKAKAWSKSHEQITNKFSRKGARNSWENKAPLSSCCNYRTNEDYRAHPKRALDKRMPIGEYSDSSDVNSEKNLVIENMRNRECEMYRKISFNNGYFDTTDSSSSGSYMYCRSNTNSVESTSFHSNSKNCACKTSEWPRKSPKFTTKRKCRSFPLTENRQIEQNISENVIQNRTKSRLNGAQTTNQNAHYHNSETETETETNTYQTNSRKITITIKTKSVPTQINNIQQQPKAIDQYLAQACETSEESDTTVSDYATLCSESESNAIQALESDNNNKVEIASSNTSESSDDNSFFSITSDIECQSETSQYFNCASFTELNTENDCLFTENIVAEPNFEKNQRDVKQFRKKMVKHTQIENNTQTTQTKNVKMNKSNAPMICIEHELCENRIVTSKIEVDKEKIREFKRRHKKQSHPKIIIDNSFSEEIFNQTLNRSSEVCCDKSIIDDIVSSLEVDKCDQSYTQLQPKSVKNMQNMQQKFVCDGFVFDKLQASPKYTGKSVSRLLAHRIEQQSITSVRRTLLHNVAYAITEKEKLQKLEKKKLIDLAPIKPPRSFTASSSSSPLSKQSFESSATVPIAELNECGRPEMGFVIPPSYHNNARKQEACVGEESSVQFGWTRPVSNVDNEELPTSRYTTADQFSNNSSQYCTAHPNFSQINSHQNIGFCIPKEEIDTVDSSSRSNKGFEQFSAILTKSHQNNLSTPIKDAVGTSNNAKSAKVDKVPVKSLHVAKQTSKPTETICKNCKCQLKNEKPQHDLLRKKGKQIGKAALKRTKTLIGNSKKFIIKSTHYSPTKKPVKPDSNEEVFSTPLKDGDNTVCNNRDTISQDDYKKCVNKSLNLTPKALNQNIVELNPSPKRTAEVSNIRLLKDAPNLVDNDKNDSEAYVTPDEAFDFERVVNLPPDQLKAKIKRSPSKMIMKFAKSSKKLFLMKGRDKDKKHPSPDESTHYYKANDYDEFDNKVLLMGEMLSDMRKRIETGHGSSTNIDKQVSERPLSAKKCLFRDRTVSTSSGDLLDQESLVDQIATIDLHDEPEPLYAEIEQVQPIKRQDTLYHSCLANDVNAIKSCSSTEPVDLKEVYISAQSDSQPSKYIMVNNNPKILYATVNRNSMQTRSLETIESKTEFSEDQMDEQNADKQSFRLNSSFESLDMSLINDFATAVQTELDECQLKMNDIFTTATSELDQTGTDEVDARKSNSGSESIATSDLNSGCSSFYRRNKNIVFGRPRKTLSDFIDTLSFDTVGTASYCESLSRGNDLNNEIKDTITSLEYMTSEMGDSTEQSDDFATNNTIFRSCIDENDTSKDSDKFVSINRPDCESISSSPSSSLYRTFGKADSPLKKAIKMSPSLKAIKSKLRHSFRMDNRKPARGKNESFVTDGAGSDETGELKSFLSTSSRSCADLQRRKLFESICSRLETMPNDSWPNGAKMKSLIEKIRQQQEMRKSIESALDVCRTNGEFHNSRELVEAEQLMLMSSLKECSALERLIVLWQSDNECAEMIENLGEGVLTIKYLEFELKVDAIYDAHFNYFYVCVCSYNDQVEFTDAKERQDNRIVFNNIKMQFSNLSADFEIRVEIYALRLRKNASTEKGTEFILSRCDSSRFRLQGKTLLTSSSLSRKHVSSSYHSPRKLQCTSDGKYVYTSYGLISPDIILCGQVNTLSDSLKIGYQEQLYFQDSKANGFLNLADAKQKWDRLWCRIDGFSMQFWNYPQDVNDTQSPILTLNLDQCNYRTKSLLVDREICPRPRTFKIDVVHAVDPEKRDRNRCVQSYFISAESQLDLELWLSEIQKIFEMIKSWNI